jgi:hypothetical protein
MGRATRLSNGSPAKASPLAGWSIRPQRLGRRASDIHIETEDNDVMVIPIDGIKQAIQPITGLLHVI